MTIQIAIKWKQTTDSLPNSILLNLSSPLSCCSYVIGSFYKRVNNSNFRTEVQKIIPLFPSLRHWVTLEFICFWRVILEKAGWLLNSQLLGNNSQKKICGVWLLLWIILIKSCLFFWMWWIHVLLILTPAHYLHPHHRGQSTFLSLLDNIQRLHPLFLTPSSQPPPRLLEWSF